ncbi:MAG: hypothetical protein DWQ01_01705 [Planctomycetota bacterium]|nr:MAG: hypothetical protein DWQ01_01705 [Planctomycetota bacterium]
MKKALVLSATLALAAAAPVTAQQKWGPLPELDAVKWYNSPPLSLADFQEKAVLIEVFRTW